MTQRAYFAAGCFWGIEAAFRQIPGVLDAISGYSGGRTENPTYEQVCGDATGHAETVEVAFDPAIVSYDRLLDAFWTMHDPTQGDRQGPDVGSQYRSAIFFTTPEQQAQAKASRDRVQAQLARPITTQIAPAGPFYRAEEYHQRYHERHGGACRVKL